MKVSPFSCAYRLFGYSLVLPFGYSPLCFPQAFPIFLLVYLFSLLSFSSLYILDSNQLLVYILQVSFTLICLFSLLIVLWDELNFSVFQLISIFLFCLALLVSCLINVCHPKIMEMFSVIL